MDRSTFQCSFYTTTTSLGHPRSSYLPALFSPLQTSEICQEDSGPESGSSSPPTDSADRTSRLHLKNPPPNPYLLRSNSSARSISWRGCTWFNYWHTVSGKHDISTETAKDPLVARRTLYLTSSFMFEHLCCQPEWLSGCQHLTRSLRQDLNYGNRSIYWRLST